MVRRLANASITVQPPEREGAGRTMRAAGAAVTGRGIAGWNRVVPSLKKGFIAIPSRRSGVAC